jgi:hypothetical protein
LGIGEELAAARCLVRDRKRGAAAGSAIAARFAAGRNACGHTGYDAGAAGAGR